MREICGIRSDHETHGGSTFIQSQSLPGAETHADSVSRQENYRSKYYRFFIAITLNYMSRCELFNYKRTIFSTRS